MNSSKQRADFRRVVDDERRFPEIGFDGFLEHQQLQCAEARARFYFHLHAGEFLTQPVSVGQLRQRVLRLVLHHRFDHGQSRERLRKIERAALVFEDFGTQRFAS